MAGVDVVVVKVDGSAALDVQRWHKEFRELTRVEETNVERKHLILSVGHSICEPFRHVEIAFSYVFQGVEQCFGVHDTVAVEIKEVAVDSHVFDAAYLADIRCEVLHRILFTIEISGVFNI